jgi:bifunctional N-acetylglucosamine-1-phosphate-uridyltransferase/glucosamine-1-phosphate-acetyltransferase GlmU-like protein
MVWYSTSNFFSPPGDARIAAFLADSEHVWDLLDGIGPFVSSVMKPNVETLRKLQGGLVPRPAALFEGETYVDAVTYDLRGPDGIFRVFVEGNELHGASLVLPGAFLGTDDIEIGAGVLVESGAWIAGPTILMSGVTVRQGAYVRGSVLAAEGALIGHATEAKNVLMLEGATAGHFAYLGDSILGKNINLGAGTKLANLKMNSRPFRFHVEREVIKIGRRKFGAVLGDGVETGCNSVTNPGTLIGKNCRVMANVSVKSGYYDHLIVLR